MHLSGLHLLLTYQCTLECEHCFVWGSPRQNGTMTLKDIQRILQQGKELGTVEWIYFEGGEPFLYYAVMVQGVRAAASLGFKTGIVSNGYWAQDLDDALEWLNPFVGLVHDLSISNDLYHDDDKTAAQASTACAAAERLGIPFDRITIAQPEAAKAAPAVGQLPPGESTVMYRGRAAEKLTSRARPRHWSLCTTCPYEDLREPGRVHIDPLGNVHICQGISLGNLYRTPLSEICEAYDSDAHPIIAPLLNGGPAELVRHYAVTHEETYADACHLCYDARRALRRRHPEILTPDQMYGVFDALEGVELNDE